MEEQKKAPLIGEFSGPQNNAPRTSAPLQRKSPPETVAEDPEMSAEEAKLEINAALNLAAIKRMPPSPEELQKMYVEGLKEQGLTIEDARRIQDKLLTDLVYTEEVPFNSRISIKIRTRIYRDVERTLRLIESEAPRLPMHVDDLLARYNVASSLMQYGETLFKFPDLPHKATEEQKEAVEDAFYARLDFVMGLPTPVMGKLIDAVAQFDAKLTAVLSKGAPEDF